MTDFSPVGGAITLSAGAGATMTLASTGTNTVSSAGGNVALTADFFNITQGVNAATGNVLIQPVTAGQLISLGTASSDVAPGPRGFVSQASLLTAEAT